MKKITCHALTAVVTFAASIPGYSQTGSSNIDLDDVVIIEPAATTFSPGPSSTDALPNQVFADPSAAPRPLVSAPAPTSAAPELDTPIIPRVVEALPDDMKVIVEMPDESEGANSLSRKSAGTINLDYPDIDVRTVLRNIADLEELNLVIPDTLQGRSSVKLKGITWRQAFDVLLEPLGFTFVEQENIIRIKSIEELTTEPVDTRVFIANYARAGELQDSISPLVDPSAGGRIQVDVRSNALVITERPSRMNKIQEIIERLDRATDQVMIESKFIEVANDDVKNIGVNWASLSGYSVSAGPFTRSEIETDTDTRTQTFTDSNGTIRDTTNVGQTVRVDDRLNSLSDISNVVDETINSAVFSANEFEVILSALRTNDDIKLVSNPTVVTLNNKKAKINIGDRFPLPEYSFNSETGQRQLDGIEYIDIGINLDVTPQVNSAGFINLEIIPEVSSVNGTSTVEATEIPIIASRKTETNIVLKDGYTLAIGGLVENQTTNSTSKVPLLGDLPGVGRVFRSNTDSEQRRNLIIFITAKTLNPDGSTYKEIVSPRVLDEMGIIRSDLPGYVPTAQEVSRYEELENLRFQAEVERRENEARQNIEILTYNPEEEAAVQAAPSRLNATPRSLR